MKTNFLKPNEVKQKWYEIDADGKILGKVAVKVAQMLRGKTKPEYSPDRDCGDYVIVTNAAKVKTTGRKLDQKIYFKHTGYIGNAKYVTLKEMLEKKPEEVIFHAVKGMLPKNRLGRQLLTKLRVYKDAEHKHSAQKPIAVEL